MRRGIAARVFKDMTKYNNQFRRFKCPTTSLACMCMCMLLPRSLWGFVVSTTTTSSGKSYMPNNNLRSSSKSFMATKIIQAPPLLFIDGTEEEEEGAAVAATELEIVYTTDTPVIEEWLQNHVQSSPQPRRDDGVPRSTQILGFDTETVPRANFLPYGRRQQQQQQDGSQPPEGPATLQLSTLDSCLVVHLTHCLGNAKTNLDALQDVLEDASIIKAGVGIDDDALEMYRSCLGFELSSRLDLGYALVGIPGTTKPGQRIGLQDLLKRTCNLDLPKSRRMSMSNWGAKTLTKPQLCYAARDAWAAAQVMHSLRTVHDVDDLIVPLFLERSERSLADMDVRARTRKTARLAMKELKAQESPLTAAQEEEHDRLAQILDEMRPDKPISFNISVPGD